MLELASVGAKVLQTRSVGLAMKEKVRVQVLSSFLDEDGGSEPGTLIVGEEELDKMEQQLISGIAHDKNDAKITLTAVLDQPGSVAAIFSPLADAGINVDMIVKNVAHSGDSTDVTCTVQTADLARSIEEIGSARERIGFIDLKHDPPVSKLSVVGVGMRSPAASPATVF